ncbi:radical SAM protein, partial [Candidatus Pelagibacter sp.]|nr:radical SAM protein [Candidatus Pelagibacter sp.]
MSNDINPGFDEVFVPHNISNEKILYFLKEIVQSNINKEKLEIIYKILENYEKIITNKYQDVDFSFNDYDKLEISKIGENIYDLERYFVYRYKYKTYPVRRTIEEYPPCVQIEPSSICNFRCIMCYQKDKSFSDKKNNYMGFMKYELFKKIIDEINGKVEAITFASRGEPTLHKEFIKFLEYCRDKFIAIKINTNLSTLTEKLARAFFENKIQTIVISADDADKDNYEKIRVKGKFEKLLANIDLLNKIKKDYPESKTIIRVSGVKINKNQNIEKMKKLYGEFADSVAFVNYLPWESSYENEKNEIEDPCSDLWKRMFIWYDGKMNPCDYDYKSLLSKSNANDTLIKDYWNSAHYNFIRSQHNAGKRE